jgi:hypothetical protein
VWDLILIKLQIWHILVFISSYRTHLKMVKELPKHEVWFYVFLTLQYKVVNEVVLCGCFIFHKYTTHNRMMNINIINSVQLTYAHIMWTWVHIFKKCSLQLWWSSTTNVTFYTSIQRTLSRPLLNTVCKEYNFQISNVKTNVMESNGSTLQQK